jgi:hypothetical protein
LPGSPSDLTFAVMRRHALLAILTAGCYSYAPLETSRLQPGEDVRMRVTAGTAEQIEPLLGRSDARVLTGTVITTGADTLIVEVPTTARLPASGTFQTLNQRVSIPRTGLVEVEGRTLNRTRTWLATGAAAVIVGAIVLRATVENAGTGGEPGGGPPELRVPVFRLHR